MKNKLTFFEYMGIQKKKYIYQCSLKWILYSLQLYIFKHKYISCVLITIAHIYKHEIYVKSIVLVNILHFYIYNWFTKMQLIYISPLTQQN